MLLPKLSFIELHNVLSSVLLLHEVLLLIKKLTSQQIKCRNGPVLTEFTGLTMLPTILKQFS